MRRYFRFFLAIALFAMLAIGFGVNQPKALAASGPCDIYASGGTPCVAAHSTVRALFGSYSGNLYQVKRASDNTTMNIGVLSAGGYANAAAQDSFCSGTSCVITIIYDQSGRGNDLTPAPAGGAKNTPDNPANAAALPITIAGHKAYGVWIDSGMGYRRDSTSGIATGDAAETEYMVTSGTHFNGGCCFDYGNAETNNLDDGAGTMEAVFFGNIKVWTFGSGSGPWLMADLENGLFGCAASPNGSLCSNDPSITNTYVTAMVKGHSGGTFGLKEGNAQSGGLTTVYNGPRPSGYSTMKKQGAIILGIGGDNSNSSVGSFYEGVMTSGDPSDTSDNAVQANIVAAGYGSNVGGPTSTPVITSVPQTNPVVYYKFDGNANDSSGNGKNATLVNSPTFVTGKINQAVNIAGGTQYVSMPSGILSGMTNFSIDTWVNVTSNATWARIFDFGSNTTSYMFLAPTSGSVIRFAITVSGNTAEQQINGTSVLSTGVWHNVAVTLNGTTGTLYVDGTQVGQNTGMTLNPSSLGSTPNNYIGKSQFSGDPDLNGAVDEFRIYNRALSASEVQALWNSTSPTNTPTFVPPSATPGATKTNTPVPTSGPSSTPAPTKTNTPVPTAGPTTSGSDPCASPTVITGGGTFNITTATTCFKYVNTSFVNGGMFTVMKDASSTSDTLKWYGGLDQNATSCANQSSTISGNGGQLDNFTIAKDANGQMFLTVTGAASNSVTLTIQNWQNGTGCSVKPTVHP